MRLVIRLDIIDDDGSVSRKCVAKVSHTFARVPSQGNRLQVFKTDAARAKDYLNEALTQVAHLGIVAS